MLSFPLGNLLVGVSSKALQQDAHVEVLGAGRSVVGLT